MKKIITLFSLFISSLFFAVASSSSAYAYLDATGVPTMAAYTSLSEIYTYDGTITDYDIYEVHVDLIDTPTSAGITMFFDENIYSTDIGIGVIMNLNGANTNGSVGRFDFTRYDTTNVSNNFIYFPTITSAVSEFYLHYVRYANTPAPLGWTALYLRAKFYNGNPSQLLTEYLTYADGVAAGEIVGYADGTTDTAADIFTNGISDYGFNSELSFDYLDGYSEGESDGQASGYATGYATGYASGYDEGQDDFYATGSTANGYAPSGSYDVSYGFGLGRDAIYTNGSTANGYIVEDSFDYEIGVATGIADTLQSANLTFMADFKNWIIPAIVVVLLLGSFIYLKGRRQ